MNRIGMKHSASPLLKMSFETTCTFLIDATAAGDSDNLESPSSRLIMGRPVYIIHTHAYIHALHTYMLSMAFVFVSLATLFLLLRLLLHRSRLEQASSTCVCSWQQPKAVDDTVFVHSQGTGFGRNAVSHFDSWRNKLMTQSLVIAGKINLLRTKTK